jgi:hypothetical protein
MRVAGQGGERKNVILGDRARLSRVGLPGAEIVKKELLGLALHYRS